MPDSPADNSPEDKFEVKCKLCRVDITRENGKYLSMDSVWRSDIGWLCHYCAEGIQLPLTHRN